MYFALSGFRPATYDEAIRQLEAAGAGAPAERLQHFALDVDGQIHVFDVWNSQESFHAFGPALVPVLTGLGVEPVVPMISPVHNSIES